MESAELGKVRARRSLRDAPRMGMDLGFNHSRGCCARYCAHRRCPRSPDVPPRGWLLSRSRRRALSIARRRRTGRHHERRRVAPGSSSPTRLASRADRELPHRRTCSSASRRVVVTHCVSSDGCSVHELCDRATLAHAPRLASHQSNAGGEDRTGGTRTTLVERRPGRARVDRNLR